MPLLCGRRCKFRHRDPKERMDNRDAVLLRLNDHELSGNSLIIGSKLADSLHLPPQHVSLGQVQFIEPFLLARRHNNALARWINAAGVRISISRCQKHWDIKSLRRFRCF